MGRDGLDPVAPDSAMNGRSCSPANRKLSGCSQPPANAPSGDEGLKSARRILKSVSGALGMDAIGFLFCFDNFIPDELGDCHFCTLVVQLTALKSSRGPSTCSPGPWRLFHFLPYRQTCEPWVQI